MKIICKDNFDREGHDDILVAENVQPFYLHYIVEFLNEKFGGETSPSFFVAKEDSYKLYVFEP